MLLDVDVQGGHAVKAAMPGALAVFLLPPSMDELERRLRGRGTDAEKVVEVRLANAGSEIEIGKAYDAQLINDDLDRCVGELEALVQRSKENPQ